MSKPIHVAVYGTLRKGEYNNRLLMDDKMLGVHRVAGFSMYSNGGYPYAVTGGKGITVELYSITPQTLKWLDRLEGYPRHYNREKIKIDDVNAWIYFMDTAPVGEWISKVPSGDWMRANRVGDPSDWMV